MVVEAELPKSGIHHRKDGAVTPIPAISDKPAQKQCASPLDHRNETALPIAMPAKRVTIPGTGRGLSREPRSRTRPVRKWKSPQGPAAVSRLFPDSDVFAPSAHGNSSHTKNTSH